MTAKKTPGTPDHRAAVWGTAAEQRESASALARLGGSETALEAISRRQSEIKPIGVAWYSNPPEASG
jgi:hypothetical protein